jgi:hypothetical protein
MRQKTLTAIALVLALTASGVWADDLTGADRLLCTAVQATKCVEDGDCYVDLPWNLNIPQFLELDLAGKVMRTTVASGENRVTPIMHLIREDGVIVLQGFEKGRAFSFVITEQTGQLAVAVAAEGRAVSVFGACTPLAAAKPAR